MPISADRPHSGAINTKAESTPRCGLVWGGRDVRHVKQPQARFTSELQLMGMDIEQGLGVWTCCVWGLDGAGTQVTLKGLRTPQSLQPDLMPLQVDHTSILF